jgi:hypothetical protein
VSRSILFLVLLWEIYSRFISQRKFRVRVLGFRVHGSSPWGFELLLLFCSQNKGERFFDSFGVFFGYFCHGCIIKAQFRIAFYKTRSICVA